MKKLLIAFAIILAALMLAACDGSEAIEEAAVNDIFAEDTATALSFPEDEILRR